MIDKHRQLLEGLKDSGIAIYGALKDGETSRIFYTDAQKEKLDTFLFIYGYTILFKDTICVGHGKYTIK